MAGSTATAKKPPRKRRTRSVHARKLRDVIEFVVEWGLFLAAASSVAITLGIVFTLMYESMGFFSHVSILEFFGDTVWAPSYYPPRYGIWSLVSGTAVTTLVALLIAIPIGTIVAIYLSEFAPASLRETVKPSLELLSAIPTVVYGYFALAFIAPIIQACLPEFIFGVVPKRNMLSAGIAMGIMIIPYVSSLSEDAMRAVPMIMREGSFALGANRLTTAIRVVYPAALSGIAAAYILGISRALGETMIVAIAAGLQTKFTLNPFDESCTMTAFIVNTAKGDTSHGSINYQSMFAVGLSLFVATLFFNCIGFYLRHRYREVH